MQEITIRLFDIAELSEQTQAHAIEAVRTKLDGPWWDTTDNDDLEAVMIATLAEKLDTPGWHTYGVADFPGISNVTVVGWDLSRGDSFAVTGILTRANAPALPWVEAIDQVTLTGHRSDTTTITVCDSLPDCTCPPDHYLQRRACLGGTCGLVVAGGFCEVELRHVRGSICAGCGSGMVRMVAEVAPACRVPTERGALIARRPATAPRQGIAGPVLQSVTPRRPTHDQFSLL